jgi:hypothetical protein
LTRPLLIGVFAARDDLGELLTGEAGVREL